MVHLSSDDACLAGYQTGMTGRNINKYRLEPLRDFYLCVYIYMLKEVNHNICSDIVKDLTESFRNEISEQDKYTYNISLMQIVSPSGSESRGFATGKMFNRKGEVRCSMEE